MSQTSKAGGRPATARLPEIVEISQQQNQHGTNSTIWIPTTHVFRENSPKSIQNGEKFVKKEQK
jgi:hypothetical protein